MDGSNTRRAVGPVSESTGAPEETPDTGRDDDDRFTGCSDLEIGVVSVPEKCVGLFYEGVPAPQPKGEVREVLRTVTVGRSENVNGHEGGTQEKTVLIFTVGADDV